MSVFRDEPRREYIVLPFNTRVKYFVIHKYKIKDLEEACSFARDTLFEQYRVFIKHRFMMVE